MMVVMLIITTGDITLNWTCYNDIILDSCIMQWNIINKLIGIPIFAIPIISFDGVAHQIEC